MQNAATLANPAGLGLKQWLIIDALTCLATGAAFVTAAGWLSQLLGLPSALLFYAGVVLFPCAALMLLAARTLAKPLTWLVIVGNAAWAAASIIVAFAFEPTPIGVLVILAQAAVVALLGLMEWRALR